jgi:hypothetical protein
LDWGKGRHSRLFPLVLSVNIPLVVQNTIALFKKQFADTHFTMAPRKNNKGKQKAKPAEENENIAEDDVVEEQIGMPVRKKYVDSSVEISDRGTVGGNF